MKEFITKDSGKRKDFESGMRRDTDEGKPRYDLIQPEGTPEKYTMLHRWAMLMSRGAEKYGERNWEKANSLEEQNRFRASAFRHFMQWFHGQEDEDHAAAVAFNLNAYEETKRKVGGKEAMRYKGFDYDMSKLPTHFGPIDPNPVDPDGPFYVKRK